MESKPVDYTDKIQWELPDGTIHREDGPAVECKYGGHQYRINGKLHRLDGPALIWANGYGEWSDSNL